MPKNPISPQPTAAQQPCAEIQSGTTQRERFTLDAMTLSTLILIGHYALILIAPYPHTPDSNAEVRQILAGGAALLLLGLFGLQRRRVLSPHATTWLRFGLAGISLLLGQLFLYLAQDLSQLLHISLAIAVAGFVLSGTYWLPLLLAGNAALGITSALTLLPAEQQLPFNVMLLGISIISSALSLLWPRLLQWPQPTTCQEARLQEEIELCRERTAASQQVLTTLAHATHNLAGISDPSEVFNLALRQLQKVVVFDTAVAFLAEGDILRASAWLGRPNNVPADLAISLQSQDPAVQVFQSQQSLRYDDKTQMPANGAELGLPCRSWLGVPLTSAGEKLGLLVLTSRQANRFGDADSRWARAIADYMIATLRNTRLTDWAQRGVDRLSFLLEAASALSATLNSEEVLQQLLNLTLKHFQPAAVSIALVNADGSVTFHAASGQVADQMIGLRLPPGEGIAGWVAEHGEPQWVPDTYADKRFHVQTDMRTGFRTEALYATPVIHKQRTVAVIEMINPAQNMELTETREIMTALADLAASAIQNARLFEQVCNAEARYQQLFDLNMDPVVIIDENGQLLDLNQEAQSLLALSADTKPDACLSAMGLTEESFAEAKTALRAQKILTWEYKIPDANNDIHTLKAHFTALLQYRPEPSYQWLAHDITDRVALEAMREQLSHMIIHDLRGPLNSIMNSIELIRTAWQQKDLTMPIEQLLHISLRSAQRMDRLINTILDTARLRQGERPLSITTIDIPQLVHEAEEISQPMLTHRRQTLTIQLPPRLPAMQGDVDLLRRVLINLLNNAIKFTPNNGQISLQATVNDEEFQFSVRDNGPGIPLNEQTHIFDMYTRGTATGQIQGSGVGLAFCKLAVEAHGGRIWLESAPNEGANFTVAIPRILPREITNG